MSFKNFSTAQKAPAAPNTADKPKEAASEAKAATPPEVTETAPKS